MRFRSGLRCRGVRKPPVCPVLPLVLWLGLFGLGGQVVAGVGGPQAALKSPSQLSCQGQSLGRWITSRLADLASRPETAISCRRIVAVVALAWNTEAMAPAARVRLNEIAAKAKPGAVG